MKINEMTITLLNPSSIKENLPNDTGYNQKHALCPPKCMFAIPPFPNRVSCCSPRPHRGGNHHRCFVRVINNETSMSPAV